jgi:hypothetical protein
MEAQEAMQILCRGLELENRHGFVQTAQNVKMYLAIVIMVINLQVP